MAITPDNQLVVDSRDVRRLYDITRALGFTYTTFDAYGNHTLFKSWLSSQGARISEPMLSSRYLKYVIEFDNPSDLSMFVMKWL